MALPCCPVPGWSSVPGKSSCSATSSRVDTAAQRERERGGQASMHKRQTPAYSPAFPRDHHSRLRLTFAGCASRALSLGQSMVVAPTSFTACPQHRHGTPVEVLRMTTVRLWGGCPPDSQGHALPSIWNNAALAHLALAPDPVHLQKAALKVHLAGHGNTVTYPATSPPRAS